MGDPEIKWTTGRLVAYPCSASKIKTQLIFTIIQNEPRHFGYSPFHDNDSSGAFLRIFTVAFDRLFQVRLGDCPTGLDNWPRRVGAPSRD